MPHAPVLHRSFVAIVMTVVRTVVISVVFKVSADAFITVAVVARYDSRGGGGC